MNTRKIIFLSMLIMLAAILAVLAISLRRAAAIGIIGSADGPTSILVTKNGRNTPYLLAVLVFGVAIIASKVRFKR